MNLASVIESLVPKKRKAIKRGISKEEQKSTLIKVNKKDSLNNEKIDRFVKE